MRGLFRIIRSFFALMIVALIALLLWIGLGDHAEVDGSYRFDPSRIPVDLDTYLAQSEQQFDDIVPGVQKRIVWAGSKGERTEWAVVYLHGFSASSEEIRPVTDLVANALGANLFYTRIAGHGRDGPAMAEPGGADWLADTAEAIEIGRRIGDKVLVIGTSTGGTLATAAAHDPKMREGLAGLVLISPNFEIANPAAMLLTLPKARWWVPKLAGETRSFTPRNAAQEKYWTTSYPTVATVTLAHLVSYVDGLDHTSLTTPALFMFSDADQVVSPEKTREVAAQWGGPVQMDVVDLGPGDDASAHVIAGDIASPGQNDRTVQTILNWVSGL